MSRGVTKHMENVYRQARLEAAEHNPKLLTIGGAADEIPGVEEASLKRYETGYTIPPNDVVSLMADTYNAPELRTWYCVNECPLGARSREMPKMPPERALIRMRNACEDISETLRQLAEIMEDGEISEDEKPMMPEIQGRVLELRRRTDELLTSVERAVRNGKF